MEAEKMFSHVPLQKYWCPQTHLTSKEVKSFLCHVQKKSAQALHFEELVYEWRNPITFLKGIYWQALRNFRHCNSPLLQDPPTLGKNVWYSGHIAQIQKGGTLLIQERPEEPQIHCWKAMYAQNTKNKLGESCLKTSNCS